MLHEISRGRYAAPGAWGLVRQVLPVLSIEGGDRDAGELDGLSRTRHDHLLCPAARFVPDAGQQRFWDDPCDGQIAECLQEREVKVVSVLMGEQDKRELRKVPRIV